MKKDIITSKDYLKEFDKIIHMNVKDGGFWKDDEVKSFIKKVESESYERGKEEGMKYSQSGKANYERGWTDAFAAIRKNK